MGEFYGQIHCVLAKHALDPITGRQAEIGEGVVDSDAFVGAGLQLKHQLLEDSYMHLASHHALGNGQWCDVEEIFWDTEILLKKAFAEADVDDDGIITYTDAVESMSETG